MRGINPHNTLICVPATLHGLMPFPDRAVVVEDADDDDVAGEAVALFLVEGVDADALGGRRGDEDG